MNEEVVKIYGKVQVIKRTVDNVFFDYCLKKEGRFLYTGKGKNMLQHSYPALWLAELHAQDIDKFIDPSLN